MLSRSDRSGPTRALIVLVALAVLLPVGLAATSVQRSGVVAAQTHQFVFDRAATAGWIAVDRRSPYDPDRGWGFTAGRTFSVALPADDYDVQITSDGAVAVSAESIDQVSVTTSRRDGVTSTGFPIALIDGRLDLRLGGDARIASVVITPQPARTATEIPVLHLIGDSTVQTYTEADAPLTGWGQRIDRYLDPAHVSVQNHAMYGRSTKTFVEEGRLDEVLRQTDPGDYVAIQLGHNDAFTRPERHTSVATYAANLTTYVEGVRQRQATPVLITPMVMRHATFGGVAQSFPTYVAAMKQVATELGVTLVDLNRSSHDLVAAMGIGPAQALYLHSEPGYYTRYLAGVTDDVHFNALGAAEMARLVARGLAGSGLPLATAVRNVEDDAVLPPAPLRLRTVGIENGAVRFRWRSALGADAYRVWARDDTAGTTDVGESGFVVVRTVADRETGVLGLQPGHRYTITVSAVAVAHDAVVESQRSEPLTYLRPVEEPAG